MRDRPEAPARVLGHVRGYRPGATVVVVAGLHGNEPAGVEALERVVATFPPPSQVRGEVLAVAGNLGALAVGVRFLDSDMNRGWWPESLRSDARRRTAEDEERRELLEVLDPAIRKSTGPAIVLDLHTTSGDTPPFLTLGDTLRNRRFAGDLPLPVVLGLEEQLAGTFLEYVNNRGCVALGCEGGRHDDPASADHLEAVTWLALVEAGVVDRAAVPVPDPWSSLEEACRGLPSVVEVRHRESVPRTRTLILDPGFRSFQKVRAGERLGEWDDGEAAVAPESGRILMPLYQSQGEDGYFIIRDVRKVWLRVSAVLRQARADRVAALLPGVRRHPYIANAVIVDRRVARWFAMGFFHLLGFRRRVEQGHELIMARRHLDTSQDRARPPD